jgi:hypothetical protein
LHYTLEITAVAGAACDISIMIHLSNGFSTAGNFSLGFHFRYQSDVMRLVSFDKLWHLIAVCMG